MFTIPETTLEAGVPARAGRRAAGRAGSSASRSTPGARDVVVRRTLIGILDSLRDRVQVVAAAAQVQDAVAVQLAAAVEAAYDGAHVELRRSLADGSVVRGEVPARWQEFVSNGDVFRSLEPGGGRLIDRLRARVRPRVAPAQPVLTALAEGVETLAQARARGALEGLARNLAQSGDAAGAGASLVASRPELTALPADARERTARAVREWRAALLRALREMPLEGPAGALGLDGAVAALSVLAVEGDAQPDVEGDGAAEGGTVKRLDGAPGTVAEAVLAALYGLRRRRAAGRRRARRPPPHGWEQLIEAERERVRGVLAALGLRPGRGEALRARAMVVEEAR